MAVTWGAVGTAASGTTSCTPSYPTGISSATSKLFCVVTGRSNTANTAPTMPAGWTSVLALEGGTGTWGVDTGTRRVEIFRKNTVTGSESGTVTVSLSGTTANTLRASIIRVEVPSGYDISVAASTGADTTNGTGYSATGTTNLTFAANQLLLIAVAQNIDTGTNSAQSITASGITFGTLTNRANTAVTNGNDHRHLLWSVPVSSGSGTVAPTFAYTISASGSGPTGFLLLTEVPALSLTQSGEVAVSGAVSASGDIDIGAPAPADGGFSSPVFLSPFGFGASAAQLTLVQSGAVAISGAASVSGDIELAIALVQSGAVAVTGALSTSGNLALSIGISGTINPSGTLSISGDLSYFVPQLTLSQSGAVAVAGTLTPSGSLSYQWGLAQSGSVTVTGSASVSGDLTYSVPSLTLSQSGDVAVSGVLATVGAIGYALSLSQSGAVAVTGAVGTTGDVLASAAGFRSAVALWPYGFGADVTISLDLSQSGSIGLSGAVSASSDLAYNDQFEIVAPLELTALQGALSISGDLRYALALVQTGSIAVSGTVAASGNLSIAGPAELVLAQNGALGISGSVSASGNLGFNLGLSQTAALAISGGVSASGDLTVTVPPALVLTQAGSIGLLGAVSPSGSLGFDLSISQSGSAGINGSLAVSGGIAIDPGSPFALVQSGAVNLTAVLTAQGSATLAVGFGEVDPADPKFQRPAHNTRIRWERKRKKLEPADKPSSAAPSPLIKALVERAKPRSTGIGQVVAAPAPVKPVSIDLPEVRVVAPPPPPKATPSAPPEEASLPAAPPPPPPPPVETVAVPKAAWEAVVADMERITLRIQTLEDQLASTRDQLAKAQRAANQAQAHLLALQLLEEDD